VTVAILGYGQLGRALALALTAEGDHAVRVWTRGPTAGSARARGARFFAAGELAPAVRDADLVWLAVSDRALEDLVERLAALEVAWQGKAVLHSSGAASAEVLRPLAERGAETAACHPLRALASAEDGRPLRAGAAGGRLFEGAPFTLEGSPAALETAERLIDGLGGLPLASCVVDRALYHLAAAVASNYGALLRDWSARRFESAGLSAADAARAADALLTNAVANARASADRLPLTGPIRRGDLPTVRAHLSRLSGAERLAYAGLGLLLLETAAESGSSVEMAELLRRAADEALAPAPADGTGAR
jgi:predicted short-subunit dehydrogenase-like oxidoreductase (DUF2520 family)